MLSFNIQNSITCCYKRGESSSIFFSCIVVLLLFVISVVFKKLIKRCVCIRDGVSIKNATVKQRLGLMLPKTSDTPVSSQTTFTSQVGLLTIGSLTIELKPAALTRSMCKSRSSLCLRVTKPLSYNLVHGKQ